MTTHRSTVAVLALATALVGAVGAAPPATGTTAPAAPVVFSSGQPIAIPEFGNATPYPSTIQVSGLTTPVTDVDVTLTGLTQDCMDELEVLVVAPTGQRSLLFADLTDQSCHILNRPARAQNLTLTFDDAATATVPDPAVSGTYRPTDGSPESPDVFPAPAPAGETHPAALSSFNGTTGNGTWSLFVRDEFGEPARGGTSQAGAIGAGWSLSISTAAVAGDTTAPDTRITKRPTYRHPRHSRFKVTSTEAGSTFRCRLDDGPVQACGPKVDYVGLGRGKHTLVVYAVDAAGNADATPASATWKVWRNRTGHTPH